MRIVASAFRGLERGGARVAETCQGNEDGPTRGRHYLELASVAV